MTEQAIHALQFLESLLETTMKSGQFRNNPTACGVCNECIGVVGVHLDSLKVRMRNELNEEMEKMS